MFIDEFRLFVVYFKIIDKFNLFWYEVYINNLYCLELCILVVKIWIYMIKYDIMLEYSYLIYIEILMLFYLSDKFSFIF